jgi:hypothetical protein
VLVLGAGALTIAFRLAPGDVVLLCYLDYSPLGFLERGDVSDAGDAQRGGPSYPVAVPWYRPSGEPGELDDTNPSIGPPGGDVRIAFLPTRVEVGSAAQFVALASLVATELAKIQTALASLAVTTGAGAGGLVVAGTPYVPASVAATQLKSG